MDIVDRVLQEAQKELQKTEIQTKGFLHLGKSVGYREQLKKDSNLEIDTAKQSLSKNSSHLEEAIKGKFGKKLTQTFDEQKQILDDI